MPPTSVIPEEYDKISRAKCIFFFTIESNHINSMLVHSNCKHISFHVTLYDLIYDFIYIYFGLTTQVRPGWDMYANDHTQYI